MFYDFSPQEFGTSTGRKKTTTHLPVSSRLIELGLISIKDRGLSSHLVEICSSPLSNPKEAI
jgi:hypothetical protein